MATVEESKPPRAYTIPNRHKLLHPTSTSNLPNFQTIINVPPHVMTPRPHSSTPQNNFDYEEIYARNLSLMSSFHSPPPPLPHTPFEAPHDDIYLIKDPALLASRASALLRRCTALNATMAHLTSVVESLRYIKAGDITSGHILDVSFEVERVRQAFAQLDGQMNEVALIMDGVRRGKGRERVKEKEETMEVAWMGERRRTAFGHWA
ncbi:hypothetical protein CC80DRAFT_542808 [Byssothecium circinans]|uniref:Uncharacterized protein n=1 Tax=Byssothecium circinans TaxID=147558 RepID=A0A6A5UFH1_9PLEO|nr:hypothetical protein CC80DRAFT_542808 [Byssothecium circinans]